MSHQKKIEQVLELLINEEVDGASELLHSVIVEKARDLYEELVEDEFGGDEKEDFADEIEADGDEIEADEEGEEEGAEEAEEADEEEEIEDRVEDLEAEFAQLKAEFETMMGDELGDELGDEMPMDDMAGGEFGDEMEMPMDDEPELEGMFEEEVDDLEEATKLQDEQKADLKSEDKLSAAGGAANSADKKSMFSQAPSKKDHGGKPHKIGGADESGKKASQGKDNTPEDNIDVPQKKQSAKKADGDDAGAESILGNKGNPKGA